MAKDTLTIITANRLRDGAVIFLTPEGGWDEKTDRAAVAKTPDEQARLLETAAADVKACRIVDPVAIDIASVETHAPLRLRERIRQIGPTVRPDLSRTA